jgi:hypothetical protein
VFQQPKEDIMKRLLAFVMVTLLSFSVYAETEQFELNFQNNRIIHDDSDWEFLAHEHTYKFSMVKNFYKLDQDNFLIHSYVQFDEPYNYASFSEPTDKIYTMGVLSCSRKAIMLLRQIYVKKDGEIQAIQPIQPNQYISEVEAPETARHQMYLKICSGEIV